MAGERGEADGGMSGADLAGLARAAASRALRRAHDAAERDGSWGAGRRRTAASPPLTSRGRSRTSASPPLLGDGEKKKRRTRRRGGAVGAFGAG